MAENWAVTVLDDFSIRVLNGLPPVIFGTGENGRDFTYVTDTVRGTALAASCDALIGRAVNIAYGEMATVRQAAEAIARLCERPDLAPRFIEARPFSPGHEMKESLVHSLPHRGVSECRTRGTSLMNRVWRKSKLANTLV